MKRTRYGYIHKGDRYIKCCIYPEPHSAHVVTWLNHRTVFTPQHDANMRLLGIDMAEVEKRVIGLGVPPDLVGRWPYSYTAEWSSTGRLPKRKIDIKEWPHHDAHVMTWRMWKTIDRGTDYRTQYDAHVRAWWPFSPLLCGGQNDGPVPLEHTGEAIDLIMRLEKLAAWHDWMNERRGVLGLWATEVEFHRKAANDLRQVICEMREIFT